jgi:hypothetical protein
MHDGGGGGESGLASFAMAITRRTALIYGGGSLAVVAAGVGGRACQTGLIGASDEPVELWQEWQKLPWPMPVVAAGVLAASPHNTQPWRFRLDASEIELELDERQALGPVDPVLRQMALGAGCAVENMVVAARGLGRDAEVAVLPDASRATVAARLSLVGGGAARPELLDGISRRHTHRGVYHRNRRLERSLVDELVALASTSPAVTRVDLFDRDDGRGRAFIAAIGDATRALIADDEFMRASDRWFRTTPREEAQHRDGVSLRCAGLPSWKRILAALAPRQGDDALRQGWLTLTIERHLGTAPAFGALSVRDPADRHQLIASGRLWQRLQLAATMRGLALQPLDQLLELADRERQLGRPASAAPRLAQLTDAGWHPVMNFRVGWPQDAAPASVRRPLGTFIVHPVT